MKSTVLVIVIMAVLAGVFAVTGKAQSNRWVVGSPYYQTEDHLGNKLETKYDWAYCSGIKRFGYIKGDFLNDRYRVFDCTYKLNGTYCSDVRYASIKMAQVGHWRLKVLRPGSCF
jgi:hypothetical protein